MSQTLNEDQSSDEETVFFGKLTLKEVKKHILWSDPKPKAKARCEENNDIKIIETHSAPDLNQKEKNCLKTVSNTSLSPNTPNSYSNWELKPADDSFLKLEKMVTELGISQRSEEKGNQLDNTLDIVDYILKNGSSPNKGQNIQTETINQEEGALLPKTEFVQQLTYTPTPIKKEVNTVKNTDECFATPSTHQKEVFKTPRNPLSQKKATATSLKKTPCKNNAYQHIASPIASYIKNCPVAPLVKDVRPTKPLPGSSSIPKFVKAPPVLKNNGKENVHLPSIAYKSAKKTKVIETPDDAKLPATQWMKKITSSLPKPVVLKHNHRENNLAKRNLGLKQEDSFADLSLHQADVSVCTKKSAFNKPKTLL